MDAKKSQRVRLLLLHSQNGGAMWKGTVLRSAAGSTVGLAGYAIRYVSANSKTRTVSKNRAQQMVATASLDVRSGFAVLRRGEQRLAMCGMTDGLWDDQCWHKDGHCRRRSGLMRSWRSTTDWYDIDLPNQNAPRV